MKACIVTIGDELLIGQVIDTNSAKIARMLEDLGIAIKSKHAVGDTHEEILHALQQASTEANIILITGGLGPTKDDVTKKALADYFNVELIFSGQNKRHLEEILSSRSIPITDDHYTQCYIPENAILLDNQMGTAMGMWFEHEQKIFVSMPGVPYEMEFIMRQEVLPRLKNLPRIKYIYHRTIHTLGIGETTIAKRIEPLLATMPDWIKLAYLPAIAQVRLRLSGEHETQDLLHENIDHFAAILLNELDDVLLVDGDSKLEIELGLVLKNRSLTLGTAESCTGGHLAHKITSIPGSSAYYLGSIIAYDNKVKLTTLGVQSKTIETHGVVSEKVVREMAQGGLKALQTDYCIALSGVAGPDGGTVEKPVGTVWICVSGCGKTIAKRFQISKDRQRNIETSAIFGMMMLWKMLKGKN